MRVDFDAPWRVAFLLLPLASSFAAFVAEKVLYNETSPNVAVGASLSHFALAHDVHMQKQRLQWSLHRSCRKPENRMDSLLSHSSAHATQLDVHAAYF